MFYIHTYPVYLPLNQILFFYKVIARYFTETMTNQIQLRLVLYTESNKYIVINTYNKT